MNKYLGWSNYETWLMNLHLTNDYKRYVDVLKLLKDNKDIKNEIKNEILDVLERIDNDFLRLLISDMCLSFISEVNWQEIIDSLTEDLR